MFEVKVTKKTYYEISDFRGVKDPHQIEGDQNLRKRLSELGAHTSDILNLIEDLEASRKTLTIFISPTQWQKVERAYTCDKD